MAISAAQTSVGTSATLVASNSASDPGEGDYRTRSYAVKNISASADVFFGPSGVTTGSGFRWSPSDGPLTITLEPGESLYGVVASVAQTLHVLQVGR